MIRNFILLAVFALFLTPSFASGAIDPYAPEYLFEMSSENFVTINGAQAEMALLTFHESSQNWVLFFRHAINDDAPYDNLSALVECNGMSPVLLELADYPQWVSEGIYSIEFRYQIDSYPISYNERAFSAKYSKCYVTLSDYGAGSYLNNTWNYTKLGVEMIPYLATVEFVDCSDFDSAEIAVLNEMSSIVTMMTDVWAILWLVWSIFIVILAVFMIPIFIIIILRWAIYRITGFKLIEYKDEGWD